MTEDHAPDGRRAPAPQLREETFVRSSRHSASARTALPLRPRARTGGCNICAAAQWRPPTHAQRMALSLIVPITNSAPFVKSTMSRIGTALLWGMTLAIVQAPYIPRVVGYGVSDVEKGLPLEVKASVVGVACQRI